MTTNYHNNQKKILKIGDLTPLDSNTYYKVTVKKQNSTGIKMYKQIDRTEQRIESKLEAILYR